MTALPPMAGLTFEQPRLMGIVNVTPDSFSDGGQFATAAAAVEYGLRLVEEGADVLDVGGESTRPGAEAVGEAEEMDRVLPVVEALVARTSAPISVDTRKARVIAAAVDLGAAMWNDVSALTHDPAGLATAARLGCAVILMHAKGEPRTMQHDPQYEDVLSEVHDFLAARIGACEAAGIARSRLVIDPGIGFGKTLAHNLTLLHGIARLHDLGCPVLLGASRKRFIGALSHGAAADRRLGGSLAAVLWAAGQGVRFFRVHDVAETRQALDVWRAVAQERAD